VKSLAAALLAFQQEAPGLVMDATNPHFRNKYASLDGIMAKVRPVLNKHGLVLTQTPTAMLDGSGNAVPALTTRLTHAESGEHIEATMLLLLDKQNSQGLGSALTYARRYSITAFLALVGDEDDDGQAASQPPRARSSSPGDETPAPAPTNFKVPDAAKAASEARDMTPATDTSKKKLRALAAKLIGEGKATQTQLDSAMIAVAAKSWEPALADPVLPKMIVDDLTLRLSKLDKNAEKAQQEVAA
jgi:hypothetical protein